MNALLDWFGRGPKKGFGYKRDPRDPRDIAFKAVVMAGGAESLDLRPYLGGGILDQGSAGTCVSHSFAYAIDVRETMAGLDYNQPSRLFMNYYACELDGFQDKGGGTYLRSCAKGLQLFGTPEENLWSYDLGRRLQKAPSVKAQVAAHSRRGGRYERIFEQGAARVEAIKNALSSGHPVVFGTALARSFTDFGGPVVQGPPRPGEEIIGYHAMCVVGYEGDCAIVVNSWGPKWRNNGCVWLTWNYLTHPETQDLWVITGWNRIALPSKEVRHSG